MPPHQPDESLYDSLMGEDELGVVVRAHIHIEARLNQLLEVLAPHPGLLPRLRYEQRVNLAGALGLLETALPPLKKVGDIRNTFGHRVDTTLTAPVIAELYNSFCESDRQTILDAHHKTWLEVPNQVPEHFEDFSPRGKFIVIAISLVKLLETAREEAHAQNVAV